MLARWAMPAQDLPDDHQGWDMEAYYLAQICVTALMTVSPQRILLGGGVMHHRELYPMVRRHVSELLGGYLSSPALHDMDRFIMPPALYPNSGLVGGALLALLATPLKPCDSRNVESPGALRAAGAFSSTRICGCVLRLMDCPWLRPSQ